MCRDILVFFARHQPFVHKFRDLIGVGTFAFERTLPDHRYSPARILKGRGVSSVSCDIFVELSAPEIYIGSGRRGRLATVAVPETAMDEQDRLEPGEDDIRRSRQPLVVKPISQPNFVQRPSKFHLRAGILLADTGHDLRTCLLVHNVQASSPASAVVHILSTIPSNLSSSLLVFRNSE